MTVFFLIGILFFFHFQLYIVLMSCMTNLVPSWHMACHTVPSWTVQREFLPSFLALLTRESSTGSMEGSQLSLTAMCLCLNREESRTGLSWAKMWTVNLMSLKLLFVHQSLRQLFTNKHTHSKRQVFWSCGMALWTEMLLCVVAVSLSACACWYSSQVESVITGWLGCAWVEMAGDEEKTCWLRREMNTCFNNRETIGRLWRHDECTYIHRFSCYFFIFWGLIFPLNTYSTCVESITWSNRVFNTNWNSLDSFIILERM